MTDQEAEALLERALNKRDAQWATKVVAPILDKIAQVETEVAELAACMAVMAESQAQSVTVVERIRKTADVARERVGKRKVG
jgi:hypothetical protein